MNRRTFITAIASITTAGCIGPQESEQPPDRGNDTEPAPDVPERVQQYQPLMKAFSKELNDVYPQDVVGIRDFPEQEVAYIGVHHNTEQTSDQGVRQEVYEIAEVYAEAAQDREEVAILVVNVGGVEFTIPAATVQAYNDGDLDQEAFRETIGVTDDAQ